MALLPNNRQNKPASDGRMVSEVTDVSNILRGIVWESFSVAYPTNTQEVYTFYSDNAMANAVATITLNYTSSSKNNLSSGFLTKL